METYGTVRKNVYVKGKRTSVCIEIPYWMALENLCRKKGMTLQEALNQVAEQAQDGNFTSHLRVYILMHSTR